MTATAEQLSPALLEDVVRPGMRVALADGSGSPRALLQSLSKAAARHGDVSLVLGWMPHRESDLGLGPYADVRTVMSGGGLRAAVDSGAVTSVPCRMSAVPSLLRGVLRPDLLVATLVRRGGGLYFSSEVSWMRGLAEAGVPVAAVVSADGPCADAGRPLPPENITVLAELSMSPREIRPQQPDDDDAALADRVARLIPEGARIQAGPGRLGAAVLASIRVPVFVDSGLLPDAVVDLDARGLLLGNPIATYLAGSRRLYDWADGRHLLHPVEVTHDPGRLSNGLPLVAINTAVEIDVHGQVNAEGTQRSVVGGVGGHPDYAAAAARSCAGLSVIALRSMHDGRPTLVTRLSRPVTTTSHDIDVVVTERGTADLRGLSRNERTAALLNLWRGLHP